MRNSNKDILRSCFSPLHPHPRLHSTSGFPDSPVLQMVEQALEEMLLDVQDFPVLRRWV